MAAIPALFGLLMAALVSGNNDYYAFSAMLGGQRTVGQAVVDITPRAALVRAGGDLTVLCRVSYPIDSCRMLVGKTSYRLLPNNLEGDVVYAGRGLGEGECGAHIRRIQDEWNGPVVCTLPPRAGSIEVSAEMNLTVASPPDTPLLLASPQQVFDEGEQYEAQCVAARGRPHANLTWYIDDQPLLTGLHSPIIEEDPLSGLQTIRQNLSRTLSADDEGRRLACRAEHVALDAPREASRQLTVHYPPKRVDGESGPLTIFGLSLGAEGRLNVTVRASPAPRADWTVGELRLVAPQQSDDGLIQALHPMPLGGGYYNVTLVVSRITKEDVDRNYYLRVSNDRGREELALRLSTMDEPAGVELGAGAIVGIVVAVLVLLIAVFLTVFAKATDRWCFAGGSRGRDHAKGSGESSDTESAVGGRSERSRLGGLSDTLGGLGDTLGGLGARVRAALPRARDKVQATEPRTEGEEKLSEEKKGVVYAELALGEQPAGDKPPPAAAEYAEIVYTEHEQPQKEVKE